MELRQLKYFVRVVELSSMGRAALELGLATSTLSQQISQLESELSTRLLQRKSTGVCPTEAGLDFWHQAQVILRRVEVARATAQKGRLSGQITVGMAATTATVLGLPFVMRMRERYPTVGVRFIEGLTSHLEMLLNSRQLDLAIMFGHVSGKRWSVLPLLQERLFLIGRSDLPGMQAIAGFDSVRLGQLQGIPLIMPGSNHALRELIQTALRAQGEEPNVVLEIDGVHSLMNAVRAGIGATIQPGSLISGSGARLNEGHGLSVHGIADAELRRKSVLASLSDDELSPAALAARVVMTQLVQELVAQGTWMGASVLLEAGLSPPNPHPAPAPAPRSPGTART